MGQIKTALVLLGPPAAGKGTQARKLSVALKYPQISTGDMLREAVKAQSDLGRRAQKHMEAGGLVPDELVDEIVRDRVLRDDCSDGFILDGYPRTIAQARFLANLFPAGSAKILAVGIHISNRVLIDRGVGRWTCPNCGKIFNAGSNPSRGGNRCDECNTVLIHRTDDSAAVIEERLQVYHRETKPLIDFYKERNAYVEVDGERSIDEIHLSILDAIGKRRNRGAGTD